MITRSDIVCISGIKLSEQEEEICNCMLSNTTNTWQTERGDVEKLKDIKLGKLAEKALKIFFSEGSYGGVNPFVAFYDDFRIDDYKHHNSIDLIFSKKLGNLINAQEFIQTNLVGNNAKLTREDKLKFKGASVNIGEIKATRISERLEDAGVVNLDKLLKDDFLTYPYFERKSTISNSDEYLKKFSDAKKLSIEEILEIEKCQLCDWYFRVYVKESESGNDVYLIGALPGIEFVKSFNIKKMVKEHKSNAAIYLSVPLNSGIPIKEFKEENIKILKTKTNLFQPTSLEATTNTSKPKLSF